jgi:hypothetical protein
MDPGDEWRPAMTTRTIERSADISDCHQYRWWLRRKLNDDNNRVVCFVMLNPSTADAEFDDPTVRRCMQFAIDWGYSILSVRNLFPYRATDKGELLKVNDPTGGDRGLAELKAAVTADLVVAAWGDFVPFERDLTAQMLFRGKPVYCLGTGKKKKPRHPLYQPKAAPLVPFWNCEATS